MKWKTVAKVAKLVAYAVAPGAAGYVAYKHVIRPWLDHRTAHGKEAAPPSIRHRGLEGPPDDREKPDGSQGPASPAPLKPDRQ
jgi:hypothetical protein